MAFPARPTVSPYGLKGDRLETGDGYCLRSDRNKPLRLSRFPRSGPTVPDAIARKETQTKGQSNLVFDLPAEP